MKAFGATFGEIDNDFGERDDEQQVVKDFVFFGDIRRGFEIADYQRAYVWEEHQIRGVISDLEYIQKKDIPTGWPSVLLQRNSSENDPTIDKYLVGDGQQRIITVHLCLIALAHVALNKALKNSYLGDEQEAQIYRDFAYKIIPGRTLATKKALLAEIFGANASPTPKTLFFQSPKNMKMYQELIDSSNNQNLINSDNFSLREKTDASRMLNAFKLFVKYFEENCFTPEYLASIYRSLMQRIILTVLVYEKEENMLRAFSNMNSLGKTLSQTDLIKAELFGATLKSLGSTLAKKVTDEWEDLFVLSENSSFWEGSSGKNKDPNQNYFTYGLKMALDSKILNEEGISKDSDKPLVQKYRELFEDTDDIERLWHYIKEALHIYQTCLTSKSLETLSGDWYLNYAYNIIGSRHIPDIMTVLIVIKKYAHTEEDLIEICKTLVNYYFYQTLCIDGGRNLKTNFDEIFFRNTTSPFRKKDFNHEDVKSYFEGLTAKNRVWHSENIVEQILNDNHYSNSYNNVLCELFLWIRNIKYINNPEINYAHNVHSSTRLSLNAEHFSKNRSREHILSQRPTEYKLMTAEEKTKHDILVGKLGNSMLIAGKLNSKLSNKPIDEKLPIYKTQVSDEIWGDEVSRLVEIIEKNNFLWTEVEITNRTQSLAKEIAKIISPEKPNNAAYINTSTFLGDFITKYSLEEGAKVYFKYQNRDEFEEFILNKDGTLYRMKDGPAVSYLSITQIEKALNEKNSKRSLKDTFYKEGKNKKIKFS